MDNVFGEVTEESQTLFKAPLEPGKHEQPGAGVKGLPTPVDCIPAELGEWLYYTGSGQLRTVEIRFH
jgi:hypothetical protein